MNKKIFRIDFLKKKFDEEFDLVFFITSLVATSLLIIFIKWVYSLIKAAII